MAEATAVGTITAEPAYVDPSKILFPVVRPPTAPPIIPPAIPWAPEKKALILNIETEGYRPWEHKIIAIGIQDPLVPNSLPVVIMHPDEAFMISSLFMVIKEGDYGELVGYGLSFDFRFLLIKAMKHNINCKEFYDCKLLDLMQAAAQGKFEFMYKPQSPPSLSDLSDYLWKYPKPFTDLEMIKYWRQGQDEKVLEFASSQITRILALYILFHRVSGNTFDILPSGSVGQSSLGSFPRSSPTESKLTIPEAHLPELTTLRCPNCMAEVEVPKGTASKLCTICGGVMKPI